MKAGRPWQDLLKGKDGGAQYVYSKCREMVVEHDPFKTHRLLFCCSHKVIFLSQHSSYQKVVSKFSVDMININSVRERVCCKKKERENIVGCDDAYFSD